MNLPDFAYKNVVDLYNLHKDLANGSDEQRRELTKLIVQQTTFDDSKGNWGHKAEKGGSVSKDTMGKVDVVLFGWDLFNGNTRAPNPAPIPSFTLNSATQEVRFYQGIDHLNHSSGTNPPPPDNQDIEELKKQVEELTKRVEFLETTSLIDGSRVALQTETGNYITAESGGGRTSSQGKPGAIGPMATDRTSAGGWETFAIFKK